MRIVIFAPGFPPWRIGGEEYYSFYQSTFLEKLGNEVHVVAPSARSERSRKGKLDIVLIKDVKIQNYFLRTIIMSTRLLFSALNLKMKPEIVHGHDPYAEGLAAVLFGKIVKVPVVIQWHGAELITDRFSWAGDICREIVFHLSDRILFVSDLCIELAKGRLGERFLSKTSKIQPGVDINAFSPARNGDKIRKHLNIGNSPMVLTVCRLDQIKGLEILINAIPIVTEVYSNVKFVIVGSGSEMEPLRKLSKELHVSQNVLFAGHIERSVLPDYYAACDVFVVPTRGEGFGMVFLEAWSSSKPVIVTPFAQEIAKLAETRRAGIVVGLDSKDLAAQLIRLLSDKSLANALGKSGRLIVESKFAWSDVAKKIEEFYCGILQGQS